MILMMILPGIGLVSEAGLIFRPVYAARDLLLITNRCI